MVHKFIHYSKYLFFLELFKIIIIKSSFVPSSDIFCFLVPIPFFKLTNFRQAKPHINICYPCKDNCLKHVDIYSMQRLKSTT